MLWLHRQHQDSSELFLLIPQLFNSHFCNVFMHMCEELGWNRGGWNPPPTQKGGRFGRSRGGEGAAVVWNTC